MLLYGEDVLVDDFNHDLHEESITSIFKFFDSVIPRLSLFHVIDHYCYFKFKNQGQVGIN